MVSVKEKLRFLENGVDFPFYNGNPKLSNAEWLIFPIAIILMIGSMFWIPLPGQYFPIVFAILAIVPALYLCKGDYGLFFKKPRLRDFLTIILCWFGYYVWVVLMSVVLGSLGYEMSVNAVAMTYSNPSMFLIISDVIQLIGEEFLKIFVLLFVLYLVYKLTGNRGIALGVGIIISLLVFGLMHVGSYDSKILQIILIQGLGSIFCLYPYLKTKNVVVSYLLHLLVDFTSFAMVFVSALH